MGDVFSVKKRSLVMSRIRSRDTAPEMTVRRLIYGMGFRYRLCATDLPGKPDLVFRKDRKVIFVHGCFWHCHSACIDGHSPKTNTRYWRPKLARNKVRDTEAVRSLGKLGWEVTVVWECEIRNLKALKKRLRRFLKSRVQ